MFKKLFGKDNNSKSKKSLPEATGEDVFSSPVSGKVVSLEEVPDPTFSEKMMGDGIAVIPSEGRLVAPIHAEVVQVFPTKHAVGLKTANGAEILIHIGLETVALSGEGFTSHVSEGDIVEPGDLLVEFDLGIIEEKAESTITPMVITNGEVVSEMTPQIGQDAVAGETIVLTVKTK